MKHLVVGFAALAAVAIAAGTGTAWNKYLRTPPPDPQPMPSHLIALESEAGRSLLADSRAVADYPSLTTNFVPQSRRAFCGVASALTTLNAAGATQTPLDQRALFADPDVTVHPLKVSFTGMSLRDFGELLRAHGANVTVVHASESDIGQFRDIVRSNLAREGDYLLVNYQRSHLGQTPMGHISPVAAYHEGTDRLLVLDVAAHKYPPTWVELETMWEAMYAPLGPKTSTTRGFLVVHADQAGDDAAATFARAN